MTFGTEIRGKISKVAITWLFIIDRTLIFAHEWMAIVNTCLKVYVGQSTVHYVCVWIVESIVNVRQVSPMLILDTLLYVRHVNDLSTMDVVLLPVNHCNDSIDKANLLIILRANTRMAYNVSNNAHVRTFFQCLPLTIYNINVTHDSLNAVRCLGKSQINDGHRKPAVDMK